MSQKQLNLSQNTIKKINPQIKINSNNKIIALSLVVIKTRRIS